MAKVKEVKKELKQKKSVILEYDDWYLLKTYTTKKDIKINEFVSKLIRENCK